MATCKICGKKFKMTNSNQKCCSVECSIINKKNYKKATDKGIRDRWKQEFNLPQYVIEHYGVKFLRANPEAVEVLKMQNKLNGRFTLLTEKEIEARKYAVKISSDISKKNYVEKKKLLTNTINNKKQKKMKKENFNIESLRESLIESFQQLKKGKLLPKEASAITNMSGKIIMCAKIELDYNKYMKNDAKINFLEK